MRLIFLCGHENRNPQRLAKMMELAADLAVNGSSEDPVRAVLEWTGGYGVDFSIRSCGKRRLPSELDRLYRAASNGRCIGLEEEVCGVDTRPIVVGFVRGVVPAFRLMTSLIHVIAG
jgi:threonine dehydrogenase-like Zn-dependent dehydrogenase